MTTREIKIEIEAEQYKQARIELETDGTFIGSTLKINGEVVHNCYGFEFRILATEGLCNAIVHLENVPLKFVGQLQQKGGANQSPAETPT